MRCFSFIIWGALALLVLSLVRLVAGSAAKAAEGAPLAPPSRIERVAPAISVSYTETSAALGRTRTEHALRRG
jgi:hypothetical protein